jgi:putative spermidine/putrescine transport system permease protein
MPAARARKDGAQAAALLTPATLFVVGVLALPMLIMLRYSFNRYVPGKFMQPAWTAENYAKFITDPFYHKVLWTTLEVAVACTIISLVLAFPPAYFLARTRSRFKALLILLVVFPLLIGNVVRAAGWMALLDTHGLLNATLVALHLARKPPRLLYTEAGVIIGIVAIITPYMILTLQAVIEGIDRSLEEAARALGASPLAVFRRVILPLAMPGVIAGASLGFILTMNAYATPLLLGGPSFQMMTQTVYDQIASSQNWPFGAALAFVLMLVTLTVTVVTQALLQRRYRLGARAARA